MKICAVTVTVQDSKSKMHLQKQMKWNKKNIL